MNEVLAIKANNYASSIVKCLNHFYSDIMTFRGNADEQDYYILIYDNITYAVNNYDCVDDLSPFLNKTIHKITVLPNFMEFPLELQKEMVKRSSSQSPIPFIKNPSHGHDYGGFTWSDTSEGHNFWEQVICKHDFDLFFKHFNTKQENENRLQEQKTTFRGGSSVSRSGVRCRKHKARVTIKSLSYQKIMGRG